MNYAFASLGPALQLLTLIVLLVFSLLGLGLIVYLAGLPGRIAAKRGHPQTEAISVCGWVGLPTGAFWIAALVWAFWTPKNSNTVDLISFTELLTQLEQTVTQLERQLQGGQS